MWRWRVVPRDPADLTLTGFEPPIRLVDDIDAALTAHQTIVAVATA
jgi:hypothetical protein